ncbi:MAG: PilZ domain-containing protein [Desulfovibrionales bacterium]|nr:PilZ domain-containing protein [Desulfovibrionales bacterium]
MAIADRAYARIETTLKGYARILPVGRITTLFSCFQPGPSSQLSDSAQTGLSEGLLQHLRTMDEKLDAVLTILNQQSLQEDFPILALVHDISGAGLRFTSDQDFQVGQAVEMVVALRGQARGLAGTTGIVVRVDEHCGQRLWAMEFKEIRDAEREKIIQYVVDRQREQLRERHLGPGS